MYHFPNLPHSPRFTRVWVQGVVVWTDGVDDGDGRRCVERFALDDGTGPPLRIATPPSCHCATPKDPLTRRTPGIGDYVACVGFVTETNDTVGRGGGPNDGGTSREDKGEKNRGRRTRRYVLVAERVHDLSRSPGDAQREAMWNVEVPEAFKALEAAHDGGG